MQNGLNKLRFKKTKKGKITKFKFKSTLKFGTIGLKTSKSGILNLKQFESLKKTIIRITKNKLKIWLNVFTFLPIYLNPIGVRMGKGKGKFSHFVSRVAAGTIIVEITGSNKKLLIKSLIACKLKLPIKTYICFK